MDEEELALPTADPSALVPEEPIEAEERTAGNGTDDPLETSEVPADPLGADPASDSPADLPDQAELGQLREELTRLRDELRETRDSLLRREADLAEFQDLYPEISLSSLPDSVWEDVRRGIPLTAAFALSERRRIRTEEKADAVNRANRAASVGAVGGEASGFFSAREVRAMSPAEVRANYNQIMLSMPKWH